MIKLKIVRVMRGAGTEYSIRLDDLEKVEIEIATRTTENAAHALAEYLEETVSNKPERLMYLILAALIEADQLATKITRANEEQGAAGYATKAHMAAWGSEICCCIGRALNACELNE